MNHNHKNIIFIMADQFGAQHLNCYGSGIASTPALDALAARGMRFNRCYATSPVCTPNRASILTGRSPVVHGMITNNYVLPSDHATYAHVLQHHGYHVGGFGKFHHCPMPLPHPASYAHLGFDESVITEDPKWEAYIDWVRERHPEHLEAALAVAWGTPRTWAEIPEAYRSNEALHALRQKIVAPLKLPGQWPFVYPSPLPAEVHQTTWITDLALDYIRRRQGQQQPFFCFVSYVDPHDPYDPPAPYDRLFDPADMPAPLAPAWKEEGNAILDAAHTDGGFQDFVGNHEEIRRWRALYHGSVRFLDDQIARIVAHLDEQNLWDETVLVFTTDHGEMLGDYGLITKGVKPYDAGIRCPLIVAGGGTAVGVSEDLVCALDFFPSFCDWGNVAAAVRPPLEGRSFAPICAGERQPEPWPSVHVAYGPMESIITADGWRLTVFDDPASTNQLIQLRDDPGECHNRYYDPACATVRVRLLEALLGHNIRIRRTPQYCNLPVIQGQKYTPGGGGGSLMVNPIPLYGRPGDTPTWGAARKPLRREGEVKP